MTQAIEQSIDLGPSISCYPSGKQFYIKRPTFDINDIAHHLGMICRYNGAIRHFYSVAEHSVIVSLLMEELHLGDPLEGLLHDAQEAYVSDMVAPWKGFLDGWDLFEDLVEKPLRKWAALPDEKTNGCSMADSLALYIEGWYLKVDRGADLIIRGGARSAAQADMRGKALRLVESGWRVMNLDPKEATDAFLRRYNALKGL